MIQLKSERERAAEANYMSIRSRLKDLAGTDCFAVIYNNRVYTIGNNCDYETYLDFIIDMLVDDPKKFCEQGCFSTKREMYSYLFDWSNDDTELKDFLMDYFDGQEMLDYD